MKYRQLVRAAAVYDFVLAAPFAVPGLPSLLFGLLGPLNQTMGGTGFPGFDPLQTLFVQLMGSLIAVWSVLRIVRPRWEFGVADASARGLFSLHYALLIAAGGHPLGWFLLVPEVLWGLAQGVGAAVYRRDELSTD